MPPLVTYTLLALAAALLVLGFWLDGRPEHSRLRRLRPFSLVLQVSALAAAVLLLRPGRGTHHTAGAVDAEIGHGTPALLDVYSNW